MYLNEALTKLKNLKSKVARTEKYIDDSAVFYEDTTPDHNYKEELLARRAFNDQILRLKTAIQVTNANTKVKHRGELISLSELILRNASLRSELAFISKQMGHTIVSDSYMSKRAKDDVKKVFADGVNKQAFKAMVDELERAKEELEAVMAHANASTTLVE